MQSKKEIIDQHSLAIYIKHGKYNNIISNNGHCKSINKYGFQLKYYSNIAVHNENFKSEAIRRCCKPSLFKSYVFDYVDLRITFMIFSKNNKQKAKTMTKPAEFFFRHSITVEL